MAFVIRSDRRHALTSLNALFTAHYAKNYSDAVSRTVEDMSKSAIVLFTPTLTTTEKTAMVTSFLRVMKMVRRLKIRTRASRVTSWVDESPDYARERIEAITRSSLASWACLSAFTLTFIYPIEYVTSLSSDGAVVFFEYLVHMNKIPAWGELTSLVESGIDPELGASLLGLH